MRKIKTLIGMLMMIVCCMAMSVTIAFGNENSSTENVGVSFDMPAGPNMSAMQVYSTSMPDTSDLYNNNQEYSISGCTSRSNLYTNRCFYDTDWIFMSVENKRSDDLTVKLRRYMIVGVATPDKKTIPSNCSYGGSFMNLDSSKYYFIQFVGPCEFSGAVKGYT